MTNLKEVLQTVLDTAENLGNTVLEEVWLKEKKREEARKAILEETKTQTDSEVIDFSWTKIKDNILNQLEFWYKKLLAKIPSDAKNKSGIKYSELLTQQYNKIKDLISSYKNDWELKNKYVKVKSYINEWINSLSENSEWVEWLLSSISWLEKVKNETIDWLKKLQADLAILESKHAQDRLKAEYEKQREEKDDDESIKETLVNFWIPAWIAWVIAMIGWFFWLTWKGWFFRSIIDFIKNPTDWLMWLFGFWKKEEITSSTPQESKPQETDSWNDIEISESRNLWTITELSDWEKLYKNWILEIKIKSQKIKSISVNWVSYELNLNYQPDVLLWDFNFKTQNNNDYLVIWENEICLTDFIASNLSNQKWGLKDTYTLQKDFRFKSDLLMVKK